MATDWLIYYRAHQSLIYKRYGYAVLNLYSHLRDRYPEVESKDRNATVSYYARLELRAPLAEDLKHGPANPIAAIEGLHIYYGFACRRCEFATPSWKWLREHWNKEHKEQRIGGRSRAKKQLKSYDDDDDDDDDDEEEEAKDKEKRQFLGTAEKKEIKARAERQLVADIKGQWAYTQGQQEEMQKVLADGILRHETTNWLKRSGWLAYFYGRDLGKIYACSRMPGCDDDELRGLTAAIDHLFFSRCIEGLKSIPLITRLLLASPHYKDAYSRPFGPLQEKMSIDRYLVYYKRFLCYCLNVLRLDELTLLKEYGFRFIDDEALEEEILQVLARFWMQRLDGDPFDSPLWHFVGVLGIDGESRQLRPAHLFTYVLAGLVYMGRALLAEWAIPTRERPGMETGSCLMVSWSKYGELMYFMGKPILMEDICSMIAEMMTDAEDLLWGSLMFKEGADARFAIPLATIEDDLTHTVWGQSFVYSNGLSGKEVVMLEDLGQWKWAGIRKYLKLVKKFEELLLVLITELRLVNAINWDRNVFVIDGEVVLIT
ncbi:hypothetical protein B0J13DRAFT_600669 [Dactylonectria estremocensis]|uniref:Uncharacterized protein n=1 Tax=Dactylonectria estremocensis TaxID=1079267 RepID=A0A9P9CY54_9HYPO|nr:hypothetical protein B0J13DRAFT_600669 [Dactylonectria estremocensis]